MSEFAPEQRAEIDRIVTEHLTRFAEVVGETLRERNDEVDSAFATLHHGVAMGIWAVGPRKEPKPRRRYTEAEKAENRRVLDEFIANKAREEN